MPRIAARMSDMETHEAALALGTNDELVPGFILCERSEQRQAMRPYTSKFVVRPWEVDIIRLYMRGFRPLVSGDAGDDLDGRPLFILAAAKHPDRADEFMAEVAAIDRNRAEKLEEDRKPPPSFADLEDRRIEMIAEGVARGGARAQDREALKAELRAELEAERVAETETPAKRGPGRPKTTD